MTAHPAAIGFRDHSGWAIAVVLDGEAAEPRFVHRERIELVPGHLPRQVYHAVAEDGAPRELIAEVREVARAKTAEEFGRLLAGVQSTGVEVSSVAVAVSEQRLPPSLDIILSSHTMLHGAEGDLYRDCLADAAAEYGLRLVRFVQKGLLVTAAEAVGRPQSEIVEPNRGDGAAAGPTMAKRPPRSSDRRLARPCLARDHAVSERRVRITQLPEMRLAYLEHRGPLNGIGALWEQFNKWRLETRPPSVASKSPRSAGF